MKHIESDRIIPLAYNPNNEIFRQEDGSVENQPARQESDEVIDEEANEESEIVQDNAESSKAKENFSLPKEPDSDTLTNEGEIITDTAEAVADADDLAEEAVSPSDIPEKEEYLFESASVTGKDESEKVSTAERIIIEKKEDMGFMPGPDIRSDDYKIICEFLKDREYYMASAYAQAAQHSGTELGVFSDQLSHALNDPYNSRRYSTEAAYKLITGYGSIEEFLIIAFSLRTFFSNEVQFDYGIRSYYDSIKGYDVLNRFPVLGKVLYILADFKDKAKKGMDSYADYHERARADLDRKLSDITTEAISFYEGVVLAKKIENVAQRRFLETKKMMFSVTSSIGEHINLIVDNDEEMLPIMEDFLKGFMKDDHAISENALDENRVWDYICSYWDKAGDKMESRKPLPLMSCLKANITTLTNKALSLMIRWYQITSEIKRTAKDEGSLLYKKIRSPLLQSINEAFEALSEAADSAELNDGAGYSVILYAMNDIRRCIDGKAEGDEKKYFFIPFLLTDEILLNHNYMPDMDVRHSHLSALDARKRILAHKEGVQKDEITNSVYRSRLDDILNNKEDEYGSALQIIEYLALKDDAFNKEPYITQIQESIAIARQNAKQKDDNFLGELEFAQVSGQIDNTVQDMQYLILQSVEAWYEYAEESKNYGFFGKVLKFYLDDIRENAKVREEDLLNQLNAFKRAATPGIDADQKEKVIARVQQMIQAQNYTVAEDLLVSPEQVEFEAVTSIEKDYLSDYLDKYDNYYRDLASQKVTVTDVLRKKSRDKERKGANKLADNWLSLGGHSGKDRIAVLLSSLGFCVESVVEQTQIANRYENYIVKTMTAVGGKKLVPTHSIAPFGSEAASGGFRTVCVYGNHNADGLIEIMKQIGSNMNVLILLDCVLTKGEKRVLARKAKNTLGENLFGVVDRTVVAYLVQNYDAATVNRMMVALISPFGYYQPYIWESGFNMPPEIFIGRKNELGQIESPTGVNIVYGGRQLGKSALLKKAQEDIDHDELGDRAVWVEIKELDYRQAANKVGHELYTNGILYEDIDTEDWNEISRALKARLQDTRKHIPYFLLMLDEADVFIESCEKVRYAPFDALKDVQSVKTSRFKFVIAGLHNIVRFKRDAALSNNSVLTHLSSLTVKPFSYTEARLLLERPLYYLGLRFPKDKEYLITLILATVNYFPGLVQLYCAKLLEAMRKNDYAGYSEIDTPVYEVSEKHIKKVLADADFTREIRQKFIITLMLGEDDYYYILALLIAYLHHEKNSEDGYTPDEILAEASELEIQKIKSMDRMKAWAFLEELKELNVLRNTIDETHYQFSRFSFFQMMGTKADVENKLVTYMEDE